MNLRRFLDQLVSWSEPITGSLSARHANPANTLTIISVVYSTEAKTFTGPAVYVTQIGQPIATSNGNPDKPATPDPQPTESSAPTETEQADTAAASAAPSTTPDSQTSSSTSSSSISSSS